MIYLDAIMSDKSLVDRESLKREVITDPIEVYRFKNKFKDVNFNEFLYYYQFKIKQLWKILRKLH